MAYWFYMQLVNLKSTDYLQYVLITIALKILSNVSDCGDDVPSIYNNGNFPSNLNSYYSEVSLIICSIFCYV